ncbi:MAG TPA: hypothetical protein VGS62_01810 [Streptosporangiaceae bacterium]|nr:hypothetical protein [Streptosporangiaceae bacterium]
MGVDFWAGILIGFFLTVVLTIGFWLLTTKILVPELVISEQLTELEKDDGTWSYRFTVSNTGRRDAVDVTVSCTMFSSGWGSDPDDHIATIKLPVTTGRIGIMPRRARRGKRRMLDIVGPRVITLSPRISEFQQAKLPTAARRRAGSGQLRLDHLMAQGTESFISVIVYAYDSFSGARIVSTDAEFTESDIVPAVTPPDA